MKQKLPAVQVMRSTRADYASCGDRAESWSLRLTQGELLVGLCLLGCANGLAGKMAQSVNRLGWGSAALGTFDVSALVLAACCIGISFLLSSDTKEASSTDIAVGVVVFLVILLPIGSMSWLAVTLLSLYVLFFMRPPESQRRGTIILLAATVPMLWSRLVFDLSASFILSLDAALVGGLLGTHRTGNVVEFADHSGALVILPACSSLANVSLALLCWVTVSQSARHQPRLQDLSWCTFSCLFVIVVNVARMSLMGLSSAYYTALHSPFANLVGNIIIFAGTVAISLMGVRREASSRT